MAGWLENQDSSGIFIWKKLQSYCLCLTLELRAEEWGRKKENASQISGAKQISCDRKPHAVFEASDLEKSLKANLFANFWVQDFVDCSFVGVLFGLVLWLLRLLLLFFFSICMWKQTREWLGGSNRRSHIIIPNKSIAVPSLEEPHIWRNDQLVLWRHCLIWLNSLKNLKSAPSLKRLRLAHPPYDQNQQLKHFIALLVFSVKQNKIFWEGGPKDRKKNYLLYTFISGKLSSPSARRTQLGVGLVMEDSCKQMCWVN